MISIKESKANIVFGKTSLHITFDFNQKIIDVLKSTRVAAWNQKDKEWEIPLNYLSTLIDELCFIDDINLELLKEEIKEEYLPKVEYKTKPFKYQLEGITYGLNHDKWLLLDPPGLGKTLQAIYLAEELALQKNIKHTLIICGINTLKSNWKREIEKHSSKDCIIIGEHINSKGTISYESIPKRIEQLKNEIKEFFIIINIESLREEKLVDALNNSINEIGFIIFDECHACKDSSSKQGGNLLKVKSNYQVAMTGTLIMNSPLDSYVPLCWIDANYCAVTNFNNYFCNYNPGTHQIVSFKNMKDLKEMIEDNSLRRSKDNLNLPPKNIICELVDMNDKHRKFYDEIVDSVRKEKNELVTNEVDKVKLKTNNLLAMVTRLRQATACPSILTTNDSIKSSKLDRCKDLIEQITSQDKKVVVFSTFKESIYTLNKMLNRDDVLVATGDMKDEDISKVIENFQNNISKKVLLATWQKMGTGITLTSASYMIFIDTPWTNAAFEQCCDRIYRIGTKEPVFIYNLICRGTIDERVQQIIETKGAISDYVIDDKISENSLSSLNRYIAEL